MKLCYPEGASQWASRRYTWLRISTFTDVSPAEADVALYDMARSLFEWRDAQMFRTFSLPGFNYYLETFV